MYGSPYQLKIIYHLDEYRSSQPISGYYICSNFKNNALSVIDSYREKWRQIPSPIKKLIISGAILLVLWKILYTFWLEPNRILDAPLTGMVAQHSVWIMQILWPEGKFAISKAITVDKADPDNRIEHLFILKDNKSTISIADNCNGLELMIDHTVVILIMHDLNLVLNYADEVLMMGDGILKASGKAAEVLTPANIEAVFGQKVQVLNQGGLRWIWPGE